MLIRPAILAVIGIANTTCFAAEMQEHAPNLSNIRVVPMKRSPEADEVTVTIVFPEDQDVKTEQPINVQMRLEGFPLGVDTDLPRKHEIYNDPEGQSVHVFIDDQPYFAENKAFIDALDDYEEYYEEDLEFKIPFKLAPGMHLIRTILVRSFGECLKGERCFNTRTFYFQSKSPTINTDLSGPYLTYNEPQGKYHYNPKTPLLLDFYLTNCQLSKDGYKVRMTIDNSEKRILSNWVPFYIYDLPKGTHTIRLELLDETNKLVPGSFNNVERTFTLE
jgi:hypothetical protein